MKKSFKLISIILISCISLFFVTNAWCVELNEKQKTELVNKVAAALIKKINADMPKEEDLRRRINREFNVICANGSLALSSESLYQSIMAASDSLIGVFTFNRFLEYLLELSDRIARIVEDEVTVSSSIDSYFAVEQIVIDEMVSRLIDREALTRASGDGDEDIRARARDIYSDIEEIVGSRVESEAVLTEEVEVDGENVVIVIGEEEEDITGIRQMIQDQQQEEGQRLDQRLQEQDLGLELTAEALAGNII